MDRTARNKWQVRVAALVVFVLGFAAGALALNAYRSWASDGGGREHPRDKFERMLGRLDLSAEQETRVRQILADARNQVQALHRESEPRFEDVRQRTDERLREVLSPEQWQKFQQMKEEMRSRKRGGGRRGGGGPPPGVER